jgi:SOS-response transcriptional repressor LexA
VARDLLPASRCIVTRLTDTALSPRLLRGDAVLVDLQPREPRSGDLVLIEVEERILLRRYLALASGDLFVAEDSTYENVKGGPGVRIVGAVIAIVARHLGAVGCGGLA